MASILEQWEVSRGIQGGLYTDKQVGELKDAISNYLRERGEDPAVNGRNFSGGCM